MQRTASVLLLVMILICFGTSLHVLADKSYRVRSPRGNFVTLVITDQTLRNVRIYDLDFSSDGEIFSVAAAAFHPSDSSQTLSINFYENSSMVQNDYVDIESTKTVQEVNCPEAFDQIVIDYDAY